MNTSFKAASRIALAGALVMASGAVAHADTNIVGEVGLPLNPTAQIPLPGGVRIQGDYFDLGGSSSSSGTSSASSDAKVFGIHAAGRVGGTVEVNGGVSTLRSRLTLNNNGVITSSRDNETGIDIGAKYLFSRESDPVGVRLAAGAGYSKALANNFHVYVVGTKYFGEVTGERLPITGHLGLRYDSFRFDGGGSSDRSNRVSAYAGVEIPIIRNGSLQFVGEIQSRNIDGGSTPYSASLRYRPQGQPFSASLGIARVGVSDDNGLFAQVGYSFDTGGADGESTFE